jgi:hypothetical protein
MSGGGLTGDVKIVVRQPPAQQVRVQKANTQTITVKSYPSVIVQGGSDGFINTLFSVDGGFF